MSATRWQTAQRPMVGLLAVWTLATFGVLALAGADSARAATAECDRYAAADGTDSWTGSRSRPFKTAQRLVDSLSPGQVGCLGAGQIFEQDQLRIARGGAPGRPITLTSTPGGVATVRGRVWVTADADDVIVQRLALDGRNPKRHASPSISADRVVFRANDITNHHTAICFSVGKFSGDYAAVAEDTRIEGNRIHHCGRLPRTNHDHGIYVESAKGTRIVDNWIYENADRGVQLYPSAQDTYVARNVIDGNGVGVIFSGSRSATSNGNTVIRNTISNSVERHNIESHWGGAVGVSNVAEDNCVFSGSGAYGDIGRQVGFVARNNLFVAPGFRDRARADFTIDPGHPCANRSPQHEQSDSAPPGVLYGTTTPGAPAATVGPPGATAPGGTSLPSRAPEQKGERCSRGSATVLGTPGDDVLLGTPGPDVIVGSDGDDRIIGRGGADVLCGGTGRDVMVGGSGSDRLIGGPGRDSLVGGGGADVLVGGGGADDLRGGGGADRLVGGPGRDALRGGHARDVLVAGSGSDLLVGGRGPDILRGGRGRDRLFGGAGRDVLRGGLDSDRLAGGSGKDVLIGGSGGDHLLGGRGEDRLFGGGGRDVLSGGRGSDRLHGDAGRDLLLGNRGADILVGG